MNRRVLCWLTGLALLVAHTAIAQAKPVRIQRDLAYKIEGSTYELDTCKLDLYLPVGETDFPTVIWLHGGGLKHGNKAGTIEQKVANRLVNSGIGCASVDYQLSPQAKFPAAAKDVAAAVDWVHRNIAQHGGNSEALFLGGHSAGGYLAAIVGSDSQYLADHDMSPSDLRGLISISGQMATHTTILEERGIEEDARVIDRAAPLFHVNSFSLPQLVIVGGNDLPDREAVNRDYVQALRDAGRKDITLLVVPKRDHQSIIDRIDQTDDQVAQAIVEFVSQSQRTKLQQVEIGDIQPLTQFGNIYLGGQPSQADIKLLEEQGFHTIINLRKSSEISWNELDAAKQLGMEYISLPFQRTEELTDELFDLALNELQSRRKEKTLLHCGSSVRVGAIWYAYRRLHGGLSQEKAQQEAVKVGLRSPTLLEAAQAYVEKQKAKKPD